MNRKIWAIAIAVIGIALAGIRWGAKAAEPVTERHFHDYTVRITGIEDVFSGGRLEILKSGRQIYVATGDRSYAFVSRPPPGADVFGTGEPVWVIDSYSGGAHCCYEALLFGVGPVFREAGRLPGGDAPGRFRQLGGKWLYERYDTTFDYWKTPFAYSPQCRVTLGFQGGSWKLQARLMRRRPYTDREIAVLARMVSSDGWDDTEMPDFNRYNPELWEYMLDMIYSGNPKLAFEFLDLAWPARLAGEKEEFRRAFLSQLHISPYWGELEQVAAVPVTPRTPVERDNRLCSGP